MRDTTNSFRATAAGDANRPPLKRSSTSRARARGTKHTARDTIGSSSATRSSGARTIVLSASLSSNQSHARADARFACTAIACDTNTGSVQARIKSLPYTGSETSSTRSRLVSATRVRLSRQYSARACASSTSRRSTSGLVRAASSLAGGAASAGSGILTS